MVPWAKIAQNQGVCASPTKTGLVFIRLQRLFWLFLTKGWVVFSESRKQFACVQGGTTLTKSVTSPEIVMVGLEASSKVDATRQLAQLLVDDGRVTNLDGYLQAVAAREEHFPTGIEGGIAIPHAQSDFVTTPSVAVGVSKSGVDFGADDGPSDLIFLIAAPASGENAHLEILAALARKVMHEEFRDELRAESDSAKVAAIVNREVQK
jgi:fructose-specific phosphotransferase system IIA component